MQDVYECLRERLDEMAIGYPATDSQIEIRILKSLFAPEEAELFLELSPILEEPKSVADRLNRDVKEVAVQMEEMAQKGLLFRHRKGGLARYSAIPYVIGIFEFQVSRMSPAFAKESEDYFETRLSRTFQSFETPVLRTIPINRQLVADFPVAPYEDALNIIEGQKTIAVAPCICRTITRLNGRPCDKPVENCFSFGSQADYYVENKMGRYISKAEAKEIIKKNEEAGLVIQPFNSQKVGGMCSCCGNCCGVLRSLKMQPKPADAVKSNYFAQINDQLCTGCETCLERCQMEAIEIVNGIATMNLDRCIGCGLCASTCPDEVITLIQKPQEQQYEPPKIGVDTYFRIAQERGKL